MSERPHDWDSPLDPPTIGATEVHVWRARLDLPSSCLRHFEELLSPDEIGRAGKFRFPVHRDRFIARRDVLRLLLARHLGISPADLKLDYTEYGKPFLARHHQTDLRFNLSLSADLALYALTRGRDVGVDVERIRPAISEETVAERFFAAREVALLRAIPKAGQPAAFFDCWVRKEAYIKAKGLGFSLPLDSFEVSLGDREPARLLHTAVDPDEAGRWTMVALHPAPAHAAALVVEGQACTVRCWSWSGIHGGDDYRPASDDVR